jgi:1-acyl-sn-glycerol-3-phosphate acyltransferase
MQSGVLRTTLVAVKRPPLKNVGRALAGYAWTGLSCARVLSHQSDVEALQEDSRKWAAGLVKMYGIKVEVEGLEHLQQGVPTVLIANHQSYLDVVALFVSLPRIPVFIAKRELSKVPIFGRVMKTRGDIFIDRQTHDRAVQTIDETAKLLKPESPVLVFPEGTRGKTPEVQRFKRGAFQLAKKAHAIVQPIGIHGSFELWPRELPAPQSGTVRIRIGPPITAERVQQDDLEALIQEARKQVATLADVALLAT